MIIILLSRTYEAKTRLNFLVVCILSSYGAQRSVVEEHGDVSYGYGVALQRPGLYLSNEYSEQREFQVEIEVSQAE